ncbi:hypothetical protein [Paracoccus sp. IB05]|uniref:hypothetical protein n=1 Tax=Paracoccus sp. IB05 TaxID=2779367 RepID=UPI0018E84730|nr:hypothetical protein [Paracoccus sp. IB05]MBJ2153781.1 hypothetical protein [Paracoccus sp. IB05]
MALSVPRPVTLRYRLTDTRSGEEIDLPAARIAVILGIETGYIDWCIACDGAFETGDWRVTVALPEGV